MTCLVLIVAGLPGSGKTSVSAYISRTENIPVVRMGSVTETILRKKGLPINEEGEKEVRRQLRATYGTDIYAQTALPFLKNLCKIHTLVILEGVKSEEEWRVITQVFSQVKILYLEATPALRYARLLTRRKRRLTKEEAEKRDTYETDILHENNLRKRADFLICNEGTKEALYTQCQTVLKKIRYARI